MTNPLVVAANWDADASLWVATSQHIPLLVVTAGTAEELADKVTERVRALSSLLVSSMPEGCGLEVEIRYERRVTVKLS